MKQPHKYLHKQPKSAADYRTGYHDKETFIPTETVGGEGLDTRYGRTYYRKSQTQRLRRFPICHIHRLHSHLLPMEICQLRVASRNFSEPSMELMLSDGQSSLISCLENLPILFSVAFRTISNADIFSFSVSISTSSVSGSCFFFFVVHPHPNDFCIYSILRPEYGSSCNPPGIVPDDADVLPHF